MRERCSRAAAGLLVAALAVGLPAPDPDAGQDSSWTAPRTPWGDPDLQGK